MTRKKILLIMAFLALFFALIFFIQKNNSDKKIISNLNYLNNLSCPQINQYFDLVGKNKTFEKNKLLPIDTKLVFHDPSFLAINIFDLSIANIDKIEKTIKIFGLKEFNDRSESYLPVIYHVQGDQNSSTVSNIPVFSHDFKFGFLSSNVVVGIDKYWYVLTESLCNYGEICGQTLHRLDSEGTNPKVINIPKQYSPKTGDYFDSIEGIYKNSVILKLYGKNVLVEYDTKKETWQEFSSNIKYSKLANVENIMKKNGCFYYPTYQGDVVFYKHKLFSTGYPDFKYLDIFLNKR